MTNSPPSVSIVVPCLNEEKTIAKVISEIQSAFAAMSFEVVVGDNGSSDKSAEIALSMGSRVVAVSTKGYGAAILGAAEAACGRHVVIGDADGTYNFFDAVAMVSKLESGADLVIGNRFLGGIEPGAMPFLNRYFGTPLLSMIYRFLYGAKVRDINCGLRAISRERLLELQCNSTGMEFASEMMIRAAHLGLRIIESPAALRRSPSFRKPHLRRWTDGIRHIQTLLAFSSRTAGLMFVLISVVPIILVGMIGALGAIRVGGTQFTFRTAIVLLTVSTVAVHATVLRAICRSAIRPSTKDQILPSRRYLLVGISMTAIGAVTICLELLAWMIQGLPTPPAGVGIIRVLVAGTTIVNGSALIVGALVLSLMRSLSCRKCTHP